MEPLRVIVIEDDAGVQMAFREAEAKNTNVRVLSYTANAEEALKDIATYKPDAIILDLELDNGMGSGIDVLVGMKEMEDKPYVLVTTNNPSENTRRTIQLMGADFYLLKYQKNYSEVYALNTLVALLPAIRDKRYKSHAYESTGEPYEVLKARLEQRVRFEFEKLGVSHKLKGYHYLVEAILLSYETPTVSNLTSVIASSHGVTEGSVIRAMQNAIHRTWKTSSPMDLETHYTARIRSDKGAPTIMEFVAYYVDKLKTDF